MIPTPIPDDEIFPGYVRRVIGPPDGDPAGEIRAVEALVALDMEQGGVPMFRMRIVLEPGDLEALQQGEPIWLTMWGGVVPFDIETLRDE